MQLSAQVRSDSESVLIRLPCARASCAGWWRCRVPISALSGMLAGGTDLPWPFSMLGDTSKRVRQALQTAAAAIPTEWTELDVDADGLEVYGALVCPNCRPVEDDRE